MSWEEQDPEPDVELVSCHRAITKSLIKILCGILRGTTQWLFSQVTEQRYEKKI